MSGDDYLRRNRDYWNGQAAWYAERAADSWTQAEPDWGIWSIPERDVGMLRSVTPGMRVLEDGCGTGYVSAWMARRGARVVGLDNSPAQLGTALALMFSVANVFLRDVSSFVSILTNFVRFSVPMVYPYFLVDERFGTFAQFYLLNPIADAVLLVQQAFWVGSTSNPDEAQALNIPDHLYAYSFLALGISAVMLVVAQLVFTRFENRIPERL